MVQHADEILLAGYFGLKPPSAVGVHGTPLLSQDSFLLQLTDGYGDSTNYCASAIVGGSSYGDSAVLGTNFLRAWYTVYSAANGNAQVGGAQKKKKNPTSIQVHFRKGAPCLCVPVQLMRMLGVLCLHLLHI